MGVSDADVEGNMTVSGETMEREDKVEGRVGLGKQTGHRRGPHVMSGLAFTASAALGRSHWVFPRSDLLTNTLLTAYEYTFATCSGRNTRRPKYM